jgi:ubiquinone/menaquinone biosynthesis C-methylase UbiE
MIENTNPQAEQMADESMLRTLAAQAEATWPQERPLFEAYGLADDARVIDVGCGTGEIVRRLADMLPAATILGIDIHLEHLDRARECCAAFGARVGFEVGDAFALPADDDGFDLGVCRHLLQAVPTPERVVHELARVVRPGGVVHLVAEDYAMMHFHPTRGDTDQFWRDGPMTFAERTGSDLRSGRAMYTAMRRAGLTDVRVDYIVADTVRVPREVFAQIWEAWRDGYAKAIAAHTDLTLDAIVDHFESMLEAIRDPDGYGVWQIPVISGRVPADV